MTKFKSFTIKTHSSQYTQIKQTTKFKSFTIKTHSIFHGEGQSFASKIRNQTKIPTFTTGTQHCTRFPVRIIEQEKKAPKLEK